MYVCVCEHTWGGWGVISVMQRDHRVSYDADGGGGFNIQCFLATSVNMAVSTRAVFAASNMVFEACASQDWMRYNYVNCIQRNQQQLMWNGCVNKVSTFAVRIC